jgi:twitching motility protein PilT
MQFMDDAIQAVWQAGMVSPHEAFMKAIDKGRFKEFLPQNERELGHAAGSGPCDFVRVTERRQLLAP